MRELNKDIISEVRCIKDIDKVARDFLNWVIKFEHENLDKNNYSYKPEINKELDKIFDDK